MNLIPIVKAIDNLALEVKCLRLSFEERVAKAVSEPPNKSIKEELQSFKPKVQRSVITNGCQECSSDLVLRTNKSGQKFWGCITFPDCTYTQPYE